MNGHFYIAKRNLGRALTLTLASGAVWAHHSVSGQFDVTQTFEITGIVTRVDWVNPHTQIYMDVKAADGKVTQYKIESHPVAMMRKASLSKQLLLGDGRPVRVQAHPARNGATTMGYLLHLTTADGREIQLAAAPGGRARP
jgi:hypothetical protein